MLRHACLYKPTEAVLRPNRTKNKSIDLWQCTRVNLKITISLHTCIPTFERDEAPGHKQNR